MRSAYPPELSEAEGQVPFAPSRAVGKRRRRRILLVPAAAGLALSAAAFFQATPTFVAQARLLIEPPASAATTDTGAGALSREIDRITSSQTADRVIDALHLAANPDFADAGDLKDHVLALITGKGVGNGVMARYAAALSVYPLDSSRLVAVEFSSPDRDFAAWAANTVVDSYLQTRGAPDDAARKTVDALASELEARQARLAKAEEGLEAARIETRILAARRVAMASVAASAPEQTPAIDPAQMAQLLRQKLASGATIETFDAGDDEGLRRLIETRDRLDVTIASQAKVLLEGHPQMKALRADLALVKARIAVAARRLLASLEAKAETTGDQTGSIPELRVGDVAASPADEGEHRLGELEAAVAAERSVLDEKTAAYRTAMAQVADEAGSSNARVVAWAQPPTSASVSAWTLAGGGSGLVALASLLAFAMSGRRRTVAPVIEPVFEALDLRPSLAPEPEDETNDAIAMPAHDSGLVDDRTAA